MEAKKGKNSRSFTVQVIVSDYYDSKITENKGNAKRGVSPRLQI